MRNKNKQDVKILAYNRILILFDQAKKQFNMDKSLSNRYVIIARKIAMKARMHLPKKVKQFYCKNCLSYLLPPYNVRIRLQKRHVARTCLECNKTMIFPYVREQKLKRKMKKKRPIICIFLI